MIKDFFTFCSAGIIALLGWFFGGLDGVLRLLLTLVVLDYLSGISVGWINGSLSSAIGFKGIARKCFMLALVGIANIIEQDMIGEHIGIKLAVCYFYVSNEGVSILENVAKLGVPIPKILSKHFAELHDK